MFRKLQVQYYKQKLYIKFCTFTRSWIFVFQFLTLMISPKLVPRTDTKLFPTTTPLILNTKQSIQFIDGWAGWDRWDGWGGWDRWDGQDGWDKWDGCDGQDRWDGQDKQDKQDGCDGLDKLDGWDRWDGWDRCDGLDRGDEWDGWDESMKG